MTVGVFRSNKELETNPNAGGETQHQPYKVTRRVVSSPNRLVLRHAHAYGNH